MKVPIRLLLVLGAVVVVGLVVWIATRSNTALKGDLRAVTPRTLELTFLFMVAGFVANVRGIRNSLSPSSAGPIVIVFLLALVTAALIPPRTHRIYYDEDIYQNVAQNILWHARAQMCNDGTIRAGVFRCDAWEFNKEPNAFPFLLSLAFRIVGVDEAASHRMNHVVLALGAVAVYWIALMLFRRSDVALASALVYILTPQNLLWSATVAVEPSASAFAAIGIGAWIFFCLRPSWSSALFGASALAFACQFRPESGLVLAVAASATVLLFPSLLARRETYGAALLVLLLLVPHLAHLWVVRHEKWGSEEAKFSLEHVPGNARTNARYYVDAKEYPRYYTLAAFLGLLYRGRRRESGLLLGWFVLLFGIFIPFYAGSYRYGADVRFAMLSSAPLAILAGAGTGLLTDWLRRRAPSSRWLRIAPTALLVYGFTHYLPLTRAVGDEGWQARADHAAAVETVAEVPQDSMVLTHNPGMLQVLGQSAAQTSMATHQPLRVDRFFDQFPGGVYFHYNFWCNVPDPVQNEFCTKVLQTFETQLVLEKSAGRYRYALYRLYRLLPRTKT